MLERAQFEFPVDMLGIVGQKYEFRTVLKPEQRFSWVRLSLKGVNVATSAVFLVEKALMASLTRARNAVYAPSG